MASSSRGRSSRRGADVQVLGARRVRRRQGRRARWPSPRSATSPHDVVEIADTAAWASWRPAVRSAAVIVDAMTGGTGFHPPLTGIASTVVEDVNAAGVAVVAVDSPSGLSADSASVTGEAIEAAVTVALAAPKIPHVLAPAAGWVGRREVAEIGIPSNVIDKVYRSLSLDLVTPVRLRPLVPSAVAVVTQGPVRSRAGHRRIGGEDRAAYCQRWARCARAPGWSRSRRRSRACPSWPRSAPNT